MQPRLDPQHLDPSRTLQGSGAGDFLGLDHELERARTPSPAHVVHPDQGQPSMPERELLGDGEVLQGNWPEARANTWSIGRANTTPVAGERPSWLLALDDKTVPRARASIEPVRAPTNASFTDGVPVTHRVAPWFLRALGVAAGLFFVAVVARTLLAGRESPQRASAGPVQPEMRGVPNAGHELAAPDGSDSRARPGMRPAKPMAPKSAGSAMESTDSRSFLERAADVEGAAVTVPTVPESPALYVYDLAATPASSTLPDAGTPLGAGDVERWLAAQTSAAAPLSDAGAVTRPPEVASIGAPSERVASGIWEGATIPVEALSGGLRLETPSVGRVRVRLEGAERVEGRLTAIGQGRVWIQTDAGPKVIERDALRGLEQIADREPVASAPQAPRRQRVRTAGGVFYGRVLARDGRTVTLVTDAGARISVEADEVVDADPQ